VIASLLPDRERRHLLQFYVAPKMGYRTRMGLAAAFLLVGFAIQLFAPSLSWLAVLIVSLPILLVGNILLLVRGYNLRPTHTLTRGTWEKTTRDRFAKLRQLENEVRHWDESITDLTCARGAVGLLLVVIIVAFVGAALSANFATRTWATAFVCDAIVLLLPHWITGTRRGWRPIALRQQIDALETALRVIDAQRTPPCQIQPMFKMAGKGDQRLPIDARVFIRFPDGPEEFLGLQFQVALNNVQGTKYPYLYAVLVARKKFQLVENYLPELRRRWPSGKGRGSKKFALLRAGHEQALTISESHEAEVDVIVLRQRTTKQSGYHTDAAAVRWIAEAAWQSAAYILGTPPVASPQASDAASQ